jgi:hypothetical protein
MAGAVRLHSSKPYTALPRDRHTCAIHVYMYTVEMRLPMNRMAPRPFSLMTAPLSTLISVQRR